MSRPSDFVTQTRNVSRQILNDIETLRVLRHEWDALGYSGTLNGTDAFAGENSDVTETDVANVIGTTLDAFDTLLAQGHSTNLYKLL